MDNIPMPQVRSKRRLQAYLLPDMQAGDWVLYGLTMLAGWWFVVELVTRY